MTLETLWADVGFTPNPQQEQAILHVDGPLYLPAGPGSGVTVQRGRFTITKFRLTLLGIQHDKARLELTRTDTNNDTVTAIRQCQKGDSLGEFWKDPRLKGFLLTTIDADRVRFANDETLEMGQTLEHDTEAGQRACESVTVAATATYPVFNLIDRAARETGLTRPTLNRIFRGLDADHKTKLFRNPEGFAGRFIAEIKQALADHIADTLRFVTAEVQHPYPLEAPCVRIDVASSLRSCVP